jgi:hypothetical protein
MRFQTPGPVSSFVAPAWVMDSSNLVPSKRVTSKALVTTKLDGPAWYEDVGGLAPARVKIRDPKNCRTYCMLLRRGCTYTQTRRWDAGRYLSAYLSHPISDIQNLHGGRIDIFIGCHNITTTTKNRSINGIMANS